MEITTYPVFPLLITEIDCVAFDTIQYDLLEWIYDYKSNNENNGVHLSNAGGWQSNSYFYKDPTFKPFLEYINTHIHSGIKNLLTCKTKVNNMWINVNSKGDYNVSHTHGAVDLSGVFWVKTPDNCGNIIFESPHSFVEYKFYMNCNKNLAEDYNCYPSFYITPKEGSLVLFPPHLSHRVASSMSNSDRISIAFNLDMISHD